MWEMRVKRNLKLTKFPGSLKVLSQQLLFERMKNFLIVKWQSNLHKNNLLVCIRKYNEKRFRKWERKTREDAGISGISFHTLHIFKLTSNEFKTLDDRNLSNYHYSIYSVLSLSYSLFYLTIGVFTIASWYFSITFNITLYTLIYLTSINHPQGCLLFFFFIIIYCCNFKTIL